MLDHLGELTSNQTELTPSPVHLPNRTQPVGLNSSNGRLQYVERTLTHVLFGVGGNANGYVGEGWSADENGFRWMVDETSELWLDIPTPGPFALALDLHPLVRSPSHPTQRVVIQIGGIEVYRADLATRTRCEIEIPSAALSEPGRLHIKIEHPEAISPKDLTGTDDRRRLAFAVREVRLYRTGVEHSVAPASLQPNRMEGSLAAPNIIGEAAQPSTVFVGNCQMGALSSLYRRLLSEDNDREVIYIPSYNDATGDARRAVANATALVRQVLDFDPRIGNLPTRGTVWLVPHASAAFLWPFAGSPHPLNRPEPTIDQSGPYNAELGDSFLNRMIAAGTPPARAVAEYQAADVLTVRRAERMMELHLQKQRDRDKMCDIQVADRIEAQFRSVRVFRSPNHPEPAMAAWIAGELFTRMGENTGAITRLLAMPPDVLPATETPIHPAVVDHFGLNYASPARRYRFFHEGGFTFAEYADRYMRYEWNPLLAEGLDLLRKKETHLAVTKLEMALRTAQRSAIARMALAEALEHLGRVAEAIEYASQAVDIEPENGGFFERLIQLTDRARRRPPTTTSSELEARPAQPANPLDKG
jgi:hypothetical protein